MHSRRVYLMKNSNMEITDNGVKNRVLVKVGRYINITSYYDVHELSDEEFMQKYGYWGVAHPQNAFEVRFYQETNVLTQIKSLVPEGKEYFILPIDPGRRIFRDEIGTIDELFPDHLKAHVIVMDVKFNWILIKNGFNKLIGAGDQIKKKMEKKVHLAFDTERIMYSLGEIRTLGK